MKLQVYQVDAFTSSLFGGNPAAVCPLEQWLPDPMMQNIAMENNLAETAFYVPTEQGFHIRWFTPAVEVDLCGHATLAAAHVIFYHKNSMEKTISFESRSGKLQVTKLADQLELDFPVDTLETAELPAVMAEGLAIEPVAVFKGKSDYMVEVKNQQEVEKLKPDFRKVGQVDVRGVIVTAPGDEVDFVSRCFFPNSGIDEDPVTGSAHTTMVPYWSKKLGKAKLSARQLSARGGNLSCELVQDRVKIAGGAITFLVGEIFLDEE